MIKTEYDKLYQFEGTYWWYRGLHELIEFYIGRYLNKTKRLVNILDAGCGTGQLVLKLRKYGSVKGIDYSQGAVDYCIKRGINVEKGNLNECKLNDSNYDIITCIDVLCHEAIVNDIAVIQKYYYALKDNGILLLNLPAFRCLSRRHGLAVGTKRRYRRDILVYKLKEIGFDIEVQSYRLAFMFLPLMLKKYIEKIFGYRQIKSDLFPIPNFVNSFLLFINRLDNTLLKWVSFPFGSSLFIIAKKSL